MTKLRHFEYLLAYGMKIQLYHVRTGIVKETYAPISGPIMNAEVVAVYPVDRGHLRISIKD